MPAISYSFSISVEKLETILRDWNHTSHNDNDDAYTSDRDAFVREATNALKA